LGSLSWECCNEHWELGNAFLSPSNTYPSPPRARHGPASPLLHSSFLHRRFRGGCKDGLRPSGSGLLFHKPGSHVVYCHVPLHGGLSGRAQRASGQGTYPWRHHLAAHSLYPRLHGRVPGRNGAGAAMCPPAPSPPCPSTAAHTPIKHQGAGGCSRSQVLATAAGVITLVIAARSPTCRRGCQRPAPAAGGGCKQ
jgi:hypothetical protein